MSEFKAQACRFELKELNEQGHFAGYGAAFNNVDLGNDVIDPSAFDRTLRDHTKNGTLPAMLYSHDTHEPVGDWMLMEPDKKGLYVEGKLWLGKGVPRAEQAYCMMQSKTAKGLSIGYSTRKAKYDDKAGTRTLLDVDLHEVSPVQFPMNPKAQVLGIKAALSGKVSISVREAEQALREAGMPASEAKHFIALLKAGIDAERDAGEIEAVAAQLQHLQNLFSTKAP